MQRDYWVQKINHDGSPLGEPRPLYADWTQQTMPSREVTPEGIEAVAAALGMEWVEQHVPDSNLPPEEQLVEGLRRITEGQ